MGDPATGSLVDVPGGSDAVAAGGAGAGAKYERRYPEKCALVM